MPTEPQAAEAIRAAISALTGPDILRLRFAAIAFDRDRHEDLLQEAISRSLSGERQWREGVPIYWHLHEVMRSIAWNWHKKFDENLVLASQFESDDERGFIGEMTEPAPDPERQAVARLMLGRLVETCGSDRIVLGIISGKLQGKTGSEIREELNLDEKDFNAAAQRLRRSAKALVRGRRYA
jgi:hypothetical protein